jgi:hypothetical protein
MLRQGILLILKGTECESKTHSLLGCGTFCVMSPGRQPLNTLLCSPASSSFAWGRSACWAARYPRCSRTSKRRSNPWQSCKARINLEPTKSTPSVSGGRGAHVLADCRSADRELLTAQWQSANHSFDHTSRRESRGITSNHSRAAERHLAPRVRLLVFLFDGFTTEVRIDLRRAQALVSEHFLDTA